MKNFLLIAGDHYYPSKGTGDWVGKYSTYDEALLQVKGWDQATDLISPPVEINGRKYDWFEIIDLENWGERR